MAVVQNYLPGDPLLIDKIVYELKSQGIFDQFRKECIADVDTKPAYQNLRQRVEGSVSGFLNKQKWSSDMNKNQLREMLRKNIYESGFLETGVERIVDQVVNPKINSIFLPKVTEVVYKFLGIEKSGSEEKENVKLTFNSDNLLPTDLEAVSPESEKKFDISNDSQTLDDSKIDEDESPPFEPLEEKPLYVPVEENSVDSHLSGFSGLMSHDSNHSQEFSKPAQMEVSNQDSLLSKQSSEGRLSIVMSDDNDTKMEICEDPQLQKLKSNDVKTKTFDFNSDISKSTNSVKKSESKQDEKSKSDKNRKSHDKHRSRHDSKSERKDDKDKKSEKDRRDRKDRHSSKDKGKEKDRRDSKNGSSKSGKSDKNGKDSRSESKSDKDKAKTSSSSSNRHSSSSSKDKEKSSNSSSKKESTSSSKDRSENKDKIKSSSSKEKDSKHRSDKSKGDSKSSSKHDSKSDKHKKDDKHRSDRHSSSSKNKDKDKKGSKKEKKENKDDHFSSKKKSDRRSTDRDSNDGQSGLKSSSSSFDSYVSSQTQSKSQESSNSNSNTGSGDSGNSDTMEQLTIQNISSPTIDISTKENQDSNINSRINHIAISGFKLIKPKFASNIHEARRLMKIRKQLSLLEKQNILDLSQMINARVAENNKLKLSTKETNEKLNGNNSNQVINNNIMEKIKKIRTEQKMKKIRTEQKIKKIRPEQNTNNKEEQKTNSKVEQKANNKVEQKQNKNKTEHRKNNTNKINKATSNNKKSSFKKQNSIIVTPPRRTEIKQVTPEPPSPPLKSSVVSAATWDALEAKLHQSLNYSMCYESFDSSENMENSVNYNKDDCVGLEADSADSKTQRYINFTSSYITNLQNTIKNYSSTKVQDKTTGIDHKNQTNRGLKRKYSESHSDVKNNSKKFSTHHIEVHENFSLPLSPAESDNSIDKKSDSSESSVKSTKKAETEFIEKVKKIVRAPAKSQRYSSEDLYKPRPLFSGSRRRTGRNMGLD